jgi:hypothetical protein
MSGVQRSNDISASWRTPVRCGKSWFAVAVELPMFERTRVPIRHACSHPLFTLRAKARRSLEELLPSERPIRRRASGYRPRARGVARRLVGVCGRGGAEKRMAAGASTQSSSRVLHI